MEQAVKDLTRAEDKCLQHSAWTLLAIWAWSSCRLDFFANLNYHHPPGLDARSNALPTLSLEKQCICTSSSVPLLGCIIALAGCDLGKKEKLGVIVNEDEIEDDFDTSVMTSIISHPARACLY
jgi:hypothetical protein